MFTTPLFRSFVEPNLIYPKVLLIGEQAETLSVMLANFIRYLHLSADSFVVLHHFAISNCSVTCDSAYILRRFCQHMYRLSGTVTKIPIEPQKLRIHFCNLLERQILLQNDGMVILIDQFDRITVRIQSVDFM